MRALDETLHDLPFPHTDVRGKPAGTLENVEVIVEAFDIVLARPALNSEQFAPFFGPDRCPGASPENQRDVHLSLLHDVCLRHGMTLDMRTLARHVQLIGLEIEDAERRAANRLRLRKGGA